MSWERAEPHNCKDGRPCYGHKVSVKYVKKEYGGQIVSCRETFCERCSNSCDSNTIAPHREWRV